MGRLMPARARRRRVAARPATVATTHMPAPTGGLNTLDAAGAMPPEDCIALWNMVPAEYGLRSRLGSREWVTGLDGGAGGLVRSILPFTGSTRAADRLFAVTPTGIWDVSASTAAPTRVLTFVTPDAELGAGYGVAHAYVTAAGHFLLYGDELNGYHVYSESSASWARVTAGAGAGQVSGVDPGALPFVTVWKSRVWLVEQASARAWYLDAGAIYGAATAFNFGQQFRKGGGLIGLWSWTVDGGQGLDDYLVAISAGGDLVVYQGSDPSSASTFGLKGIWSLPGLPAGRRIATQLGGDLLVLTKSGIRPLSQLVVGGEGEGQYLTAKVSNLVNRLMLTRSGFRGWSMHLHPEDNTLLVLAPTTEGAATEQLVMALWNKAWSRYRGLPMLSAGTWGGKFYAGTPDGRVLVHDGYVDGVRLADANAFTPVQWSLLSSFQTLGNARFKRVQLIRPTLLSEGAQPNYAVQARYRYDFAEAPSVSGTVRASGSAWDAGLWDVARWAGEYQASQSLGGATGLGTEVAIAVRGQATSRTVLVGMDIAFDQGGFL